MLPKCGCGGKDTSLAGGVAVGLAGDRGLEVKLLAGCGCVCMWKTDLRVLNGGGDLCSPAFPCRISNETMSNLSSDSLDAFDLHVIMANLQDQAFPSADWLRNWYQPATHWEKYFEVVAQRRKGGLNPSNLPQVVERLKDLGPFVYTPMAPWIITNEFNLTSIGLDDQLSIMKEVLRQAQAYAEQCWHPDAGTACSRDAVGKVKVTHAHSIQEGRVLSALAENGRVVTYHPLLGAVDHNEPVTANASTFKGLCNEHDRVFRPIEHGVGPFHGTPEQNFLYAYRAFLHFAHVKTAASHHQHFGTQWMEDVRATKSVFDAALRAQAWDTIHTWTWTLPTTYPVAAVAGFYAEFDFEGAAIQHSENRMEYLYVTVLPEPGGTVCLMSCLTQDVHLYNSLAAQIAAAQDPGDRISALLLTHAENFCFKPSYYQAHIAPQRLRILKLLIRAQMFRPDERSADGRVQTEATATPSNYLTDVDGARLFVQ